MTLCATHTKSLLWLHYFCASLDNGQKVLFKTGNLNTLEIAEEFKILCDMQEQQMADKQK